MTLIFGKLAAHVDLRKALMKIPLKTIGVVLLGAASAGGLAQTSTPIYSYTVPANGYAPNSNLTTYTDSVMGKWSMQYDNLNRLQNADASAGPYQGVNLHWGFDSFGNRTSQTPSGNSSANLPSASSVTYNANNQMLTGNGGFTPTYDGAGNMTFDGASTYTAYDGENRVCATYSTIGSSGVTQYIYNAEGQRAAKGHPINSPGNIPVCPTDMSNFAVSATYVLGPGGEQMTEFDGSGNWKHTNVYAGGKLLATYDPHGLHFPQTDPLGTVRIQASATGVVEESCASLPFGDGLNCTSTISEPTEHHFTGKERDRESGLDYFGARYYASSMGRFMSPDWSAKATPVPYAKLDNPQSLNLYAYVGNNPLSHIDPDGHIDCGGKNAAGVGCQAIAQWNQDHGINPNAKRSNFPGVPVRLPNGNTVPDPHSPTGLMMAPASSVSDVAAAGKKAGQDAQRLDSQSVGAVVFNVELGRAVGTGGQFDDQRMGPQSDVLTGGFMQLPQFRDVSNFNVGLFSQQSGMTLDQTLQTAGDFAKHFSSNYSPNSPYGLAPQTAEFIRVGFQAGATQF